MIWDRVLWNWASPVWLVALGLTVAYLLAFGRHSSRQFWILALGLLFLVLAYVSPVGVLAEGYLFSAHMVQHLFLLLLVPLCLLLCLPSDNLTDSFNNAGLNRLGRLLSLPLLGWFCGVGAMWFWHIPTFCAAATRSLSLGGLRDISFLLAGLVFWWPIFAPIKRLRLPPLTGITYLFTACLGCTLLGIYITFTTVSVCPAFANPTDEIRILTWLYNVGLTPAVDQHLGGLLMWVPPCSLYVGVIVSLLCRWYSMTEPMAPTSQLSSYPRQSTTLVE